MFFRILFLQSAVHAAGLITVHIKGYVGKPKTVQGFGNLSADFRRSQTDDLLLSYLNTGYGPVNPYTQLSKTQIQ